MKIIQAETTGKDFFFIEEICHQDTSYAKNK
jgi:hypothetical protein